MKQFTAFVAPPEMSSAVQRGLLIVRRDFGSLVARNVISDATYSTTLVADSTLHSTTPLVEPIGVYDAVLPQTETLVGMGVISVLCVVLYFVWSEQVVPVSRTKLAISKSRGEVKAYLDELKATANPSPATMEITNTTEDRVDSTESIGTGSDPSRPSLSSSERSFERWLFTDWLKDNKSERKGGRQKEPALPILKDAKWNSGDNPIVVASLLMLVGLVLSALTERISGVA
jgi:hypothetical protein